MVVTITSYEVWSGLDNFDYTYEKVSSYNNQLVVFISSYMQRDNHLLIILDDTYLQMLSHKTVKLSL